LWAAPTAVRAVKKGARLDAHCSVVQIEAPKYPVGKTCVVALEQGPIGNWAVLLLQVPDEKTIVEAKKFK